MLWSRWKRLKYLSFGNCMSCFLRTSNIHPHWDQHGNIWTLFHQILKIKALLNNYSSDSSLPPYAVSFVFFNVFFCILQKREKADLKEDRWAKHVVVVGGFRMITMLKGHKCYLLAIWLLWVVKMNHQLSKGIFQRQEAFCLITGGHLVCMEREKNV